MQLSKTSDMWLFEWENQFGKRRIVGNSQQFREFACHNHGKKSCSSQFSSFLLAIDEVMPNAM